MLLKHNILPAMPETVFEVDTDAPPDEQPDPIEPLLVCRRHYP